MIRTKALIRTNSTALFEYLTLLTPLILEAPITRAFECSLDIFFNEQRLQVSNKGTVYPLMFLQSLTNIGSDGHAVALRENVKLPTCDRDS